MYIFLLNSKMFDFQNLTFCLKVKIWKIDPIGNVEFSRILDSSEDGLNVFERF